MTQQPEPQIDWDAIGSLRQIARKMWSVVSTYEWTNRQFSALFNRVYCHTDDLETLWQLGGAANDYLRRNPSTLEVPCELARRLLAADDREARIIGLKLLTRTSNDHVEIIREIIRSLNQGDGYEDYGGLYETGNLIDHCQATGTKLPTKSVAALVAAIQSFATSDEHHDRRCAEDRVFSLQALSL